MNTLAEELVRSLPARFLVDAYRFLTGLVNVFDKVLEPNTKINVQNALLPFVLNSEDQTILLSIGHEIETAHLCVNGGLELLSDHAPLVNLAQVTALPHPQGDKNVPFDAGDVVLASSFTVSKVNVQHEKSLVKVNQLDLKATLGGLPMFSSSVAALSNLIRIIVNQTRCLEGRTLLAAICILLPNTTGYLAQFNEEGSPNLELRHDPKTGITYVEANVAINMRKVKEVWPGVAYALKYVNNMTLEIRDAAEFPTDGSLDSLKLDSKVRADLLGEQPIIAQLQIERHGHKLHIAANCCLAHDNPSFVAISSLGLPLFHETGPQLGQPCTISFDPLVEGSHQFIATMRINVGILDLGCSSFEFPTQAFLVKHSATNIDGSQELRNAFKITTVYSGHINFLGGMLIRPFVSLKLFRNLALSLDIRATFEPEPKLESSTTLHISSHILMPPPPSLLRGCLHLFVRNQVSELHMVELVRILLRLFQRDIGAVCEKYETPQEA